MKLEDNNRWKCVGGIFRVLLCDMLFSNLLPLATEEVTESQAIEFCNIIT
jgi:hypothetical protein